MSDSLKTTKSPEQMTIAELQAEIGRLNLILHRKVLGDPLVAVTSGTIPWPQWQLSSEVEEIERHAQRF
jgi:hypothetical protein